MSSNPTDNQPSFKSALPVGQLQQDGPKPARQSAQRQKRKSASGAGKKSIHRGQTLDSGNVTPMSTSAVPSTCAETVNDATRNESPNPARQGNSKPTATISINESLKLNPRTNRQSESSPEVIYVKGAGPTGPQPPDASPPSQGPRGSTKWPEETKWRLARVSVDVLTSSSMNAGKNISVAEIFDILDQTPSFPGLCGMLERRGFNIDRGQFARLLLDTFPRQESNNSDEQPSAIGLANTHGHPSNGAVNGPVDGSINGAASGPTNRSNKRAVNGRGSGAAQNTSAQNESDPRSHGKDGVVNEKENGASRFPSLVRFWSICWSDMLNTGIPQSTHTEPSKKRAKKSRDPTGTGAGSQSDKLDRSGLLFSQLYWRLWFADEQFSDQVEPITGSADRPRSSTVRQAAPIASVTESGSRRFPDRSRLNQPKEPATSTPLSKKEMTRKRSFGDLIDLTQDLSNEDHSSPIPRALLDTGHNLNNQAAKSSVVSAPAATWDGARPTSIHPISNKEKTKRRRLLGSADQSGLSSSVATEDESSDLSRFKYADSQRDLLQSAIIIRPINKKNDALRRSTYNPRTIAGDILVSAGKHPTLAPLNHHLDILRKKFAHIDNHSDLGTFRWDLVDPVGPEVASTAHQEVVMDDADDKDSSMENSLTKARKEMKVSTADGEVRVATAGTFVLRVETHYY